MTYPKAPAPHKSKIMIPALLVAFLIISPASFLARAAERSAPTSRATFGDPTNQAAGTRRPARIMARGRSRGAHETSLGGSGPVSTGACSSTIGRRLR